MHGVRWSKYCYSRCFCLPYYRSRLSQCLARRRSILVSCNVFRIILSTTVISHFSPPHQMFTTAAFYSYTTGPSVSPPNSAKLTDNCLRHSFLDFLLSAHVTTCLYQPLPLSVPTSTCQKCRGRLSGYLRRPHESVRASSMSAATERTVERRRAGVSRSC